MSTLNADLRLFACSPVNFYLFSGYILRLEYYILFYLSCKLETFITKLVNFHLFSSDLA